MNKVIDVNEDGECPDGLDYTDFATPEVIAAGLMINVPVVLRYPDGRMKHANEARITPKGLDELRRTMPLEMRGTDGTA